jgi:hypothetical protein
MANVDWLPVFSDSDHERNKRLCEEANQRRSMSSPQRVGRLELDHGDTAQTELIREIGVDE